MAELTVQAMTKDASLTPSFDAAAELGDTFINDGKTFIYFKNADTVAARTITIASQVACNQGETHNITVTVPTESEELVGFWSQDRFNDADGELEMTYDDHTDLTIAAIKIT